MGAAKQQAGAGRRGLRVPVLGATGLGGGRAGMPPRRRKRDAQSEGSVRNRFGEVGSGGRQQAAACAMLDWASARRFRQGGLMQI